MTNQTLNNKHKFDLEERTTKFSEEIIILCKSIKLSITVETIVKQLIRSTTSVGANYMEANGSDSKKDFKNKISICKKEAKETMYWLRLLAIAYPEKKIELRKYWKEAHELALIFASITRKI